MLLAVRCRLALEIVVRSLGAGFIQAEVASDLNHAVLCMFLTIHRRLAALFVEGRSLRAGSI